MRKVVRRWKHSTKTEREMFLGSFLGFLVGMLWTL